MVPSEMAQTPRRRVTRTRVMCLPSLLQLMRSCFRGDMVAPVTSQPDKLAHYPVTCTTGPKKPWWKNPEIDSPHPTHTVSGSTSTVTTTSTMTTTTTTTTTRTITRASCSSLTCPSGVEMGSESGNHVLQVGLETSCGHSIESGSIESWCRPFCVSGRHGVQAARKDGPVQEGRMRGQCVAQSASFFMMPPCR